MSSREVRRGLTDDWPILDQPWRFFRLTSTNAHAHVFYRCPACGAVIDWRDHDLHLRYHGVVNSIERARLVKQQEAYAGLAR